MGSLRQLISHVFSSLLLVVVAGKFHRSLAICFNVMCYHALDFGNNDDLIMSAGSLRQLPYLLFLAVIVVKTEIWSTF